PTWTSVRLRREEVMGPRQEAVPPLPRTELNGFAGRSAAGTDSFGVRYRRRRAAQRAFWSVFGARRHHLRLRRQDLGPGAHRVRLGAVQQERDPLLVELGGRDRRNRSGRAAGPDRPRRPEGRAWPH